MALAEMARKAAQAAAEKKRALDQQGQSTKAQPPPAKAAKTTPRVVPPCMHEVAIPRGFDIETTSLDREIHGARVTRFAARHTDTAAASLANY